MSIIKKDAIKEELAESTLRGMITPVPRMRTIKKVAEETGLSYGYIRKLCLKDEIVHIKTGNKYMVNLDKFIEYLNNGGNTQLLS